jgi:hypothetical protein
MSSWKEYLVQFKVKFELWIQSMSSYEAVLYVALASAFMFCAFYSILLLKAYLSAFSFLFSSSFAIFSLIWLALAYKFNILPSIWRMLKLLKEMVFILWKYPRESVLLAMVLWLSFRFLSSRRGRPRNSVTSEPSSSSSSSIETLVKQNAELSEQLVKTKSEIESLKSEIVSLRLRRNTA